MRLLAAATLACATLLLGSTQPAAAWPFSNQEIADKALSYSEGSAGGQCKHFATGMVVDEVLRAHGLAPLVGYGAPDGCHYGAYRNGGGVQIGVNNGRPGDLIQAIPKGYTTSDYPPWDGLHTAIIVGVNGPGDYQVRDSNYQPANQKKIATHQWSPGSWSDRSDIFIWRFGKSVGQYARHIVQQKGDNKKQRTSWYVSADLRRLWIPDAATFSALRSTGAPKPDVLTSGELNALPDQTGCWAAAGSAMTKQRTLRREMALRSANGKYAFTLRSDGNLALTGPGNAAIWDAKVSGIDYLAFQKDGNLVGFKDGVAATVWSAQTAAKDARRFVVRNDGVAAVLDVDGKWLWSTRAAAPQVGEPFPVCTAEGNQWRPDVSGNVVVWGDSRNWAANEDIYGYDLASKREFPICTADGVQISPRISGNLVVWQDWRHRTADGPFGNSDIYGYDLAGKHEFPICARPNWQGSPAISGNVAVWEDDRNGNGDIYGYDLASQHEFAICTALGDQGYPEISGNTVVWEGMSNGEADADIWGYDLVTRTVFPICTASGYQGAPAVSDTTVVWQDNRSGQGDIFGYDLASGREFTVCAEAGWQQSPRISGESVVWEDLRSGTSRIYGCILTRQTEFLVGMTHGDQREPAISADTVVWWNTDDDNIWGVRLGL